MEREWQGLLIEPVPSQFQKILSKKRNVYSINACIARDKPIVAKFRLFDALSGRLKEMNEKQEKRIDLESGSKLKKILYVPCFSLHTILAAINVKNINYFSLDIEVNI